jgi:2-phospho-L-lactate/phosphoenolpyruvate guanylyltransferase
MATAVIPFRSSDPKRRLDRLDAAARADLAHAMLADVLAAAMPLGSVLVVAAEAPVLPPGVEWVADPHRGQGAAVRAALAAAVTVGSKPPFLVVNADLPCVVAGDLVALAHAVPDGGLALTAAPDGTTNALALSRADLFRPLYGEGSAGRFAALAPSRQLDAPNLMDDVDTLDDLDRLRDRLGEHTRRVLASLDLQSAA